MKARELLILVFTLHVAICQKPSCLQTNSYLDLLVKAGVMKLTKPSFTNASCGAEWSRFGTCCDIESLKLVVNRDLIAISETQAKVFNYLNSIEQGVLSTKELMDAINRNSNFQRKAKQSTLDAMEAFQDIIEVEMAWFKESHEKCWKEMGSLRSASVCPTCSGRSQIYFKRIGSLIPQDTCTDLMTSCFPSLLLLGRTAEISKKFLSVAALLKEDWLIKYTFSKTNSPLYQLQRIFCPPQSPLSDCDDILDIEQSTFMDDWFCARFLRLREKTLVEEVSLYLYHLDLNLKRFIKEMISSLGVGYHQQTRSDQCEPIPIEENYDFEEPLVENHATVSQYIDDTSVLESMEYQEASPLNLTTVFP